MAKKLSKSNLQLNRNQIYEIYDLRKKSAKLYFSIKNPDYNYIFYNESRKEIELKLSNQLQEIEYDACLNILASIEAVFRLDYAERCEKKDKSTISKIFREHYQKYKFKVSFEDVILEVWKNDSSSNKYLISNLKSAFKFRHWLAHGRYWTPKFGQNYDFTELYNLSKKLESFPFVI